jgi:phosphate transport system protein
MSRHEYQEDLDALRADVRAMGDDVLDQFDRSLRAFVGADAELAASVVDGDEAVNDRYLDLEGDCVDLFALQQPVAGDLRFVAASFKILTDLERVGDLGTNLARYAQTTEGDAVASVAEVDVLALGDEAATLVDDALDAYVAGDAQACHAIAAWDDHLDAMCAAAGERVVRDLVERESVDDAWSVEALMDDASRLLLAVRDLERVGDHAVNIAARTLYMVESDSELIY